MDNLTTKKNKLAARLLKAEMMGDAEAVDSLKSEMAQMEQGTSKDLTNHNTCQPATDMARNRPPREGREREERPRKEQNFKRLHEDDMTIADMYLQQKTGSVRDEVKMFMANHKKFARDSQDTSQFSEELDDSQLIIKGKSSKSNNRAGEIVRNLKNQDQLSEPCDSCPQAKLKHLILWEGRYIYMSLLPFRLNLSRLSSVVIRNLDHADKSYVDSDEECQKECQKLIGCLKSCLDRQGYQCVIMESYYKNFKNHKSNLLPSSGENHFHLYCIPIKKKYFEEARLYFKQALLECEKEWSMNKKLVSTTNEKKAIQNYLPRGLSYFWVCFDSLNKGFGHVIEDEERFSRCFGFDVLAGLLDKNIHDVLHPKKEDYKDQFERCRQFKMDWSEYRPD